MNDDAKGRGGYVEITAVTFMVDGKLVRFKSPSEITFDARDYKTRFAPFPGHTHKTPRRMGITCGWRVRAYHQLRGGFGKHSWRRHD